jgi:hypothetical protein
MATFVESKVTMGLWYILHILTTVTCCSFLYQGNKARETEGQGNEAFGH